MHHAQYATTFMTFSDVDLILAQRKFYFILFILNEFIIIFDGCFKFGLSTSLRNFIQIGDHIGHNLFYSFSINITRLFQYLFVSGFFSLLFLIK